MKICIAQTRPVKGDITQNILRHLNFVERAADLNASAIFFPELSLTGYECKLAKDVATTADDIRFKIFRELSNARSITIAAGVPTQTKMGIQISMLIFQPGQPVQTYSKQLLHSDEYPYCVRGEKQVLITVDNIQIAPAICYESMQPQHAEEAIKLGAMMYVACVAKSLTGITKANAYYSDLASNYSMPVLMVNCVGACDTFDSAGSSAVWSKDGILLSKLNNESEGILIFDTSTDQVITQPLQ